MSRFLKSRRKIAGTFLALVAILLFFTKLYILSIIISIGLISLLINYAAVRKTDKSSLFSAQREIRNYQTLVIGDICEPEVYNKFCKEDNRLVIAAPGRSLEASYQILLHTFSILDNNGQCIIVYGRKHSKKPYSVFDLPYLSLVTKKELGLDKIKYQYPLFYEPFKSVKITFNVSSSGYAEYKYCPHEKIRQFCSQKNISLIYIAK